MTMFLTPFEVACIILAFFGAVAAFGWFLSWFEHWCYVHGQNKRAERWRVAATAYVADRNRR